MMMTPNRSIAEKRLIWHSQPATNCLKFAFRQTSLQLTTMPITVFFLLVRSAFFSFVISVSCNPFCCAASKNPVAKLITGKRAIADELTKFIFDNCGFNSPPPTRQSALYIGVLRKFGRGHYFHGHDALTGPCLSGSIKRTLIGKEILSKRALLISMLKYRYRAWSILWRLRQFFKNAPILKLRFSKPPHIRLLGLMTHFQELIRSYFTLPSSGVCIRGDQMLLLDKLNCWQNLPNSAHLESSGNPSGIPEANTGTNNDEHRFRHMIGKSPSLKKAFEAMAKTAPCNASVIIYGESGTGKELAAQSIHNLSPRSKNRFVPVNCGAIPEELIESEFFGYKKGAFTGAGTNKAGYLDWADKGTLFLDEVGELSPAMQVKLLRAIDGGGYAPIGSRRVKKPDIRIIAATNRDLKEEVHKGMMREDFYYRINVLPIWLPPLRERKEDLPSLINHFLLRFSNGKILPAIPEKLMTKLIDYRWPGNVRELKNAIQRYVTLQEIHLPEPPRNALGTVASSGFDPNRDLQSALRDFEKQYIVRCLEATNWHKRNACKILKINRKTLYKKIKQYKLDKM